MIGYHIDVDPDAHEFLVRMRIDRAPAGGCVLRLPAWIPGSYMIRDFARNLTAFEATDARGTVAVRKCDKQTWVLPAAEGAVVVEYRVYAFDLSVRSAYLDRTRAYFNGTCLFLSVDGLQDAAWTVEVERPGHAEAVAWKVATTLPANRVDADGFGIYSGSGMPLLYDCPVEIGLFERGGFAVAGVSHEIAISEGAHFDMARICDDLTPICEEHAAMFGELPVDRYLFMTLATADGYGGLEHRDSTSLICKRSDLPRVGLERPDKGYRQFLGLCSHEYFHLWNVKRIRPAVLAAADLSSEVYTELLWAFEGITSYYDELALVRSGVLDSKEYLDVLAGTVTRVMRGAGRLRQSIAESSFDAWTRFYKQDENAPNAIVSYYAKGALVAFGLDLTIRDYSADRLCLDDLMRLLWHEHGRTDMGIPERGIESLLSGLVGRSFDDFFARYVYGTDELPLGNWFARVGIGFRLRAAKGADDLGGYRSGDTVRQSGPVLGARVAGGSEGLRVTQVSAGGAARSAGLAAGDLLLAIDAERVDQGNLNALLARAPGETVEVTYFRRNRLLQTQLPLRAPAADTCELWLRDDDELAPGERERRAAWLRSNRLRSA